MFIFVLMHLWLEVLTKQFSVIAFGKPQAVISEENPVEKHSDGKEKYIELSHNEKTSPGGLQRPKYMLYFHLMSHFSQLDLFDEM